MSLYDNVKVGSKIRVPEAELVAELVQPAKPRRINPMPGIAGDWVDNGPFAYGEVLYVGTVFPERGMHRVFAQHKSGPYQGMWRLSNGYDCRLKSFRTIAVQARGKDAICSFCGNDDLKITRPCTSCGLEVGAIWSPDQSQFVMGLANLAFFGAKQCAQEFHPIVEGTRFTV